MKNAVLIFPKHRNSPKRLHKEHIMQHSFTLFGKTCQSGDIPLLKEHENTFVRTDLVNFLEDWFSEKNTVAVQSSGSTGTPKILHAEKERMKASAAMTCSFLGLKQGDTALLCMPLKYIGAKMVVVRALIWGLDLYCAAPSGHPFAQINFSPDFLALTPAQVYSSLQNSTESTLLRGTKQLIIGGGAINAALAEELADFPHAVWSTYGMTETLSHIALRRLNGKDKSDWYQPFSGVTVSLTPQGTLAVNAPAVCPERLITNDIAEVDAFGRFKIIGRADNVINSGGIKLQAEKLEDKLAAVLPFPFMITSVPDEQYGEATVLLVQNTDNGADTDESALRNTVNAVLGKYEKPKHIFFTKHLPRTETDKPNRAEAKKLALQLKKGVTA